MRVRVCVRVFFVWFCFLSSLRRSRFLDPGRDLVRLLTVYTDLVTHTAAAQSQPAPPPAGPAPAGHDPRSGGASGHPQDTARAHVHRALVTVLRSWTGVLGLAGHRAGLRSLVAVLELPEEADGSNWAKVGVVEAVRHTEIRSTEGGWLEGESRGMGGPCVCAL